jgi:Fe(3+) dicitrate transport protein
VNLRGNRIPEAPREFANLTLGVESRSGWDASVSWTYRGEFFVDVENTLVDPEGEGEIGLVDDVWLVSARANYTIPGTNATLFVTGFNLEDKLYITDRADGIKPGQGRTVMGGLKVRFDHSKPLMTSWKN